VHTADFLELLPELVLAQQAAMEVNRLCIHLTQNLIELMLSYTRLNHVHYQAALSVEYVGQGLLPWVSLMLLI